MMVSTFLMFNGDCEEAIRFYEKAFGVKATNVMRYSEAPPSADFKAPAGTENYIMYSQLKLGGTPIMLGDTTPDWKTSFGSGMSITITLDSPEKVKTLFNALKEGGKITMEPQETFWSKLFGSLEDRFGVSWMISVE
ncbi:MAG: VOC family protein [Chitinispirillales bacterium]|jgi:PhnB protein|nr:VOC family protein [Chitinispirillales bacterium]